MKVYVINTGGTISCTGDPLVPMSAQNFATACGRLLNPIFEGQFPKLEIIYVTDLTFHSSTGTLDSTNLQPTDWCLMAEYILNHYADCDGWVILHGTDTMGFTGTGLPFLLSAFSSEGYSTATLSKPVIITGSQVPMFEREADTPDQLTLRYNTDAYQNFCGAMAAAQSGIPEVCIYFDSYLYRGNRSVKTNASEFKAFSSPNYPALGEYGIDFNVYFERVLPLPASDDVSLDTLSVRLKVIEQLRSIKEKINSFPVMQFNAFPAWYVSGNSDNPSSALIASLINACTPYIKGLILESYGEGNFPSGDPDDPQNGAVYQALQDANTSGIVIVDCTQVIQGVVNDSAYGAGAWLPEVGALNPNDMTPMAALAKLTILLASAEHNSWSPDVVKHLLQLNLLGEMLNTSRLDSRTNSTLLPGEKLVTLDGSASLTNDPVDGPVLKDIANKTVLWCALTNPSPDQMPGRLIMQNNGNLVFYSRDNAPIWSTDTGGSDRAFSMLVLDGSNKSATLTVYDYSNEKNTSILYPSC
ncbi:asparaginase domain-containing protein [Dapis sp. BLCC M126]|uniref:asparaginase domain-containing protein n=1 Tax=Dapis sp. BLCC M126 TaxID=3400189 RepID=UPI003CEA1B3D